MELVSSVLTKLK